MAIAMEQYYKLLKKYQSVLPADGISFHEYITLKTKYADLFTAWSVKLRNPFINQDAVFLNMLEVATKFSFEKDANPTSLNRFLVIGHMINEHFTDTTAKLISSYEPGHALILIDTFSLIQKISPLQGDTWKQIVEIGDKLSNSLIQRQLPEEQSYYRNYWESCRAPVLEYIRQTS